jgi:hypothetical protein
MKSALAETLSEASTRAPVCQGNDAHPGNRPLRLIDNGSTCSGLSVSYPDSGGTVSEIRHVEGLQGPYRSPSANLSQMLSAPQASENRPVCSVRELY